MKNNIEFSTDFFEKLKVLKKSSFLSQMINEAGVLAVKFSKDRFVEKNWKDKSTENWEPRKRKARGSLLVKSARLKRSIRKLYSGNYYVFIGTDVSYAKIHNEGGLIKGQFRVKKHKRTRNGRTIKVKAHQRTVNYKMPQRQFLGESNTLVKLIENNMKTKADKALEKTNKIKKL